MRVTVVVRVEMMDFELANSSELDDEEEMVFSYAKDEGEDADEDRAGVLDSG